MTAAERPVVLVALRTLVRVRVCRLCGSLVVVGGTEQHNRWHKAGETR